MNWDYIAGYFDGEGCLLLNVMRDKRIGKTKGSQVDGWTIIPSFSIQSYDYGVMQEIKQFLENKNFRVGGASNITRLARSGQTKIAKRIDVMGWHSILELARILCSRCIAKKRQLQLFGELVSIIDSKPIGKQKHSHSGVWTKEHFIKAMEKVDEINALKSRIRGKMNAAYFKNLWQRGGDVKWDNEIILSK